MRLVGEDFLAKGVVRPRLLGKPGDEVRRRRNVDGAQVLVSNANIHVPFPAVDAAMASNPDASNGIGAAYYAIGTSAGKESETCGAPKYLLS